MPEQTDVKRLLVLQGPSVNAPGLLDFLSDHFDVRRAENLDVALEQMRGEPFHAVLADVGDFLPLERGVVTQQASVVLDTIGDGVCIVGPSGELVWANRRLHEGPAALLDSLTDLCVRAYEQFACQPARQSERGKRSSLMPDGGHYYEVICSPVRDRDGILRQVVAVVVDATSQRRQQLKLNAIDRAGRELVRLDKDMLANHDAQERLKLLEERIMRCSRDVLDYEHIAVLLLDERSNRLEVVIADDNMAAGGQEYELFATTEGNGLCGYVAATGRSYICPDVGRDTHYLPGLPGARSSLTIPLRLHDKIIGVLNAESSSPSAFNEEDRQFAEIFSNYVAMALHILNLLVVERYNTHTRVSGSICAELAGPLNDIISEASEVMEDYIGHDDLRKRLHGLIDSANSARQRIQELMQCPTAVIGGTKGPAEPDRVLAGKHVLVADDEELIGETIRDVLVPVGCEVDLAVNGLAAIDLISQNTYDLVISDIKMPGATGYEVFSAAKEANPATAVILITAFGYDPNHSIVRARQEGLAAVIMKPFKVKKLLQQCREAVAQKS